MFINNILNKLICISILSLFVFVDDMVFALEIQGKSGLPTTEMLMKNIGSCTERCHINHMAYENKSKLSKRGHMFKHVTHSLKQGLDCASCHDVVVEVNIKGHGKLKIEGKDCLKCHHVEREDIKCGVCHFDIDENQNMKYKEKKFLHGYAVDSGVDCGLCHEKTLDASIKKNINCSKHQHLKPDINCLICHEDDMKGPFDTKDPLLKKSLSWTVPFKHSEHPVQSLLCKECHKLDNKSKDGLVKYGLHCDKCHHTTPDLECARCHKEDIKRPFYPTPQIKDSLAWTVSFNHSEHPKKDISCEECHEISKESNMGMVEYNINCSKCHHVSKETIVCINCHEGLYKYMKGKINIEDVDPVPDMMSRAVKCEDCHKLDENKFVFKGVKENCIKCHDDYYGMLFDAWKKTISDRLDKFNKRVNSIYEEDQSLQANGLRDDNDVISQSDFADDIEETGNIIDMVAKYGIHNFNLTRSVLDFLEKKVEK